MIECDWQDEEDYGSKYTIGVYAPRSDDYAKVTKKIPSLCWWAYVAAGIRPTDAMGDDSVELNGTAGRPIRWLRKTVWSWVGDNRKFSRGTAATIAAMSFFKPTAIYLVGFDDVVRGGMLKNAYHPPELQKLPERAW